MQKRFSNTFVTAVKYPFSYILCRSIKIRKTAGEDHSSNPWWLSSVRRVEGQKDGLQSLLHLNSVELLFSGENSTAKATADAFPFHLPALFCSTLGGKLYLRSRGDQLASASSLSVKKEKPGRWPGSLMVEFN
jgi:hypothetical protein